MGLFDFFSKSESLISVDVGSTAIKLVELDISGDKPRLINIGLSPLTTDIFSGNVITKSERVAEQLTTMLEANAISDKRVVTALPGPSVFTKRVKVPRLDLSELRDHIMLEAGNFIPHNIDAVKLDYHLVAEAGKNQLELLVIAVKNEIIDSYTACLSLAGLETAVADVDYFALQNIFELSYPELVDKTVGLINIGARYSSINICRGGESLFSGDISVGGKLFSEALSTGLGVSLTEAEQMKRLRKDSAGKAAAEDILNDSIQDIIDRNLEYMAGELNRTLSFFWNAAGADEALDCIMVSGGGSQIKGLCEELKEKTGVDCGILDPLRGIECGQGFDPAYLKEIAPVMSVGIGLGLRQAGDRIIPEFM